MADLSDPVGATNYTEWGNPEWFTRWNELSTTQDEARQRELINEMLEIFYNDPPWLLLYFQPDFYGVSTAVNWDPRRDEKIFFFDAPMAGIRENCELRIANNPQFAICNLHSLDKYNQNRNQWVDT
ncbi:MAG: hypothetical protein R2873_03825 [Caldilineaceae bacterium]